MTDNLILKNIIAAKRNNPYTENKTIDQLRKETGTAGALIPLPDNTKFKRILAGNVYAEWITCGDVDTDKIFMFIHGVPRSDDPCAMSHVRGAWFIRPTLYLTTCNCK